jgi:squalene/oxidosqualene cyclase-like protein
MTYVALRILGLSRDDPRIVRARKFLLDHDGAKGIPTWGKFWLASLGVYEWSGLNAVPPELWLLPDWFPLHPGRWWCHCRVVYLPMGYLYGKKSTGKITPLVLNLREELYNEKYSEIDWSSLRFYISKLDVYTDHSWLNKALFTAVNAYEAVHSTWIRNSALDMSMEHIHSEDENTHFIDIGPVNKCINMLAVWHAEGSESKNFKAHQERLLDYLWISEDGMKMQGYNGSQLWDTAFSIQAILETPDLYLNDAATRDCLEKAAHFIDVTQVREDVPENDRFYRHISKGAWPFSTRDHGWPISDCTSEGLKSALLLREKCPFVAPLDIDRYFAAVNVILSMQNTDGGWATYELKRSYDWAELINPAEVFKDIMIDYSYVECSSACVQSLAHFRQAFPFHREAEIQRALDRGVAYIKSIQKPDGSWLGKWAVAFTYGTWFGIEGLVAAGALPSKSKELKAAREWLVTVQNPNGSWGEDFKSCVEARYVNIEEGQVVNTAWAVLSLLKAGGDLSAIERGVRFLIEKQFPNGDWTQEKIKGVFNANCAISYSGYKNIFPLWALGRFCTMYPNHVLAGNRKARL